MSYSYKYRTLGPDFEVIGLCSNDSNWEDKRIFLPRMKTVPARRLTVADISSLNFAFIVTFEGERVTIEAPPITSSDGSIQFMVYHDMIFHKMISYDYDTMTVMDLDTVERKWESGDTICIRMDMEKGVFVGTSSSDQVLCWKELKKIRYNSMSEFTEDTIVPVNCELILNTNLGFLQVPRSSTRANGQFHLNFKVNNDFTVHQYIIKDPATNDLFEVNLEKKHYDSVKRGFTYSLYLNLNQLFKKWESTYSTIGNNYKMTQSEYTNLFSDHKD